MLCSQIMMCNFVVHARYAGWGHAAANVQTYAISRCQLRIRNFIVHARFVAWGRAAGDFFENCNLSTRLLRMTQLLRKNTRLSTLHGFLKQTYQNKKNPESRRKLYFLNKGGGV